VVLIPAHIKKYTEKLYEIRKKNAGWNDSTNDFFFTYPYCQQWITGSKVMKKYAKMCGAKKPELLTFTNLRKHIATTTQLLNLTESEIELCVFMNHDPRTHRNFYK